MQFKAKKDPSNGHAVPFVTGERYHIHWESGLDFTNFRADRSEKWLATDLSTLFVTNHTEIREAFNLTSSEGLIEQQADLDAYKAERDDGLSGTNFKNEEKNEFEFMINGRDPEDSSRANIRVQGLKCIEGACPVAPPTDDSGVETEYRMWSEAGSWEETNKVPEAGEAVYIAPSWNMLLDIADTPELGDIVIDGRLTLKTNIGDIVLRATSIWVKTGQFFIGDEENPFPNKATIILDGERESQNEIITSIEVGNKVLANTGEIKWYGLPANRITRLEAEVSEGDT